MNWMNRIFLMVLILIVCLPKSYANPLSSPITFSDWQASFKEEALRAGIDEAIVNQTMAHVTFLPSLIKLDRSQPEFVTPFNDYYHQRINQRKINQGRALIIKHAALLDRLESQFHVPKSVLVAFWGLETHYGQVKGNVDTLSSLATLAYEGRRANFFKLQLLDMMRMLEHHHVHIGQLKGSWAGAFGHMQFMPSTFQAYAIDGNQDGQIDVNHSIEDAMSSAANYLANIGWHDNEPIAYEITLPTDFLWQSAQLNHKKTLTEWQAIGISLNHTLQTLTKTNPNLMVAIVLPQGADGPAYFVFDNFDKVMHWNRSVFYALTVAQLSSFLAQDGQIPYFQKLKPAKNTTAFAKTKPLSYGEMQSLQMTLNHQGFDAGYADGFPGLQTQAAIRAYQLTEGIAADGHPTQALLKRIQQKPH